MKRTRILFCYGIMRRGGMEFFMMNYLRHFNHERYQVDFLQQGQGFGLFDDEIKAYGGRVFYVRTKKTHVFTYNRQIKKILVDGNYDVVHANMEASSFFVLRIAKKVGINKRIAHAHSTSYYEAASWWKRVVYSICKRRLKSVSNLLFACSKEAGEWLFGDKAVNTQSFHIIPNAIDPTAFSYSNTKRCDVRERFGIPDDAFVIGNVGRFMVKEKNQLFLLEAFSLIISRKPNSFLFLIGGGKDEQIIRAKVNELSLSHVIVLGSVQNIADFYSSFDIFVLPSFFEGFGIVLLEATANGLYCLTSTGVSNLTNIAGNITFLSIESPSLWAEETLANSQHARENFVPKIVSAGFSIDKAALALENLYD